MTTKNRIYLLALLLLPIWVFAQDAPSPAVQEYIAAYRELAIREMQRSGVPASIKLAQGILETEAGRSDLVQRSNNHFGIKCKTTWTGEKVFHDDDERGECFRKYASSEDSWKDHSDFLRTQPRYASLFTLDPMDYKGWAHGLKKAGYATNPRYPQILIKYIETYRLNDYSAIALGKTPVGLDWAALESPAGTDKAVMSGPQEPSMALPENNGDGVRKTTVSYPSGTFMINDTRVVYLEAGASLLALASAHSLRHSWLTDFNDLDPGSDILAQGQLIYLQRKRKHGAQPVHIVAEGESLYSISQQQGIRLESLRSLNRLEPGMEPAVGASLHLQKRADERPALAVSPVVASVPVAMITPVPAPANGIRHIVQSKETLFSLARKYEVTQEQIMQWNKLTSADLRVGQELVIYKQAP
jgi:LysM repeat protein